MRVPTLILVAAIAFFLGQGGAAAEKVKTNQSTKLYARKGEQAKVVMTLKSGKSMELIAKEGRWYKVRVGGRTGYVARSTVDAGDDGDISRNTRRRPFVEGRGKKRGNTEGAPDDRIGADAQGDNAPDTSEDEDDEEDEAPKPKKAATTTKAKPSKDEDEEDEDEEDEAPKGKKPPVKTAPKTTPVKTTKPPAKGGDDDEDEEEDDEDDVKPKTTAKPATKPAPTGGDDDEDEDEDDDTKAKPAAKGGDEDEEDVLKAKSGDTEDKEDEEDKRPRARVTKKVGVHEKPEDDSEEAFVVQPTDTLFPGESENGWTYIKNAEGDGGWVPSDVLEMSGGGSGKRAIDVRARMGLLFIQQAIRSAGSTNLNPPDNYNVITRAAMVSLGAGVLLPRGKLLFGGELTYDIAKTLGGVPYDPDGKTGSMPAVEIPLTFHNVNVRALVGLDFKKPSGMALIGRLGYHYQGFLVADVGNITKNPAQLPSEVIKGPTVGAGLTIPRLTPKIGLNVGLDAMLFGASLTQTKGLEDGASPSAQMINVEAGFSYHLKSLAIQAIYDLNYMGVSFGAPLASSQRMHMGTSVKRSDIFHLVTFGISKGF